MNEKVYRRNVEQLMRNMVWPVGGGLMGLDPDQQRIQAIAEVLCRMPEEGYKRLLAISDSFIWFIPHYHSHGAVESIPTTIFEEKDENGLEFCYTKLLYLSPRLERVAWDIVVAVVTHELAHLILGHNIFPESEEEYEAQEAEVFELVCKWGFEREAKKHRAMNKWRESYINP